MNRHDAVVCQAIDEMRLLLVEYGGRQRLVQPHVYGDDTHGDRLLSAYQVDGGSASGKSEGWKSFRMDRVGAIEITDERFPAPRPEFQRNDGAFVRIVRQLGD
ncbi:WYL domain-containing protein [Luteibacter aegosomatis]|uniref:WYL domain-containing protein n=1 Tax=Luteibacter aegosomatis TaxID=2911537 RepID=UPI001FFBA456|nr:WYL domain-containing protein [Luteibacter aegosomatis]UPG86232.1 WYL domain-containing protein [Luteibacter aegosomatis]